MNRKLWTARIEKGSFPAWRCPTCGIGTISLVDKSLQEQQTADSAAYFATEGNDPEFYYCTFRALGKCTNRNCNEFVSVVGKGATDSEQDEHDGHAEYFGYFEPLACYPMLAIIQIPTECPKGVQNELASAFSVFWMSPESSAGRIRVALEHLMDHLKIPARQKTAAGKYHDLSLHDRIGWLQKNHPKEAGLLMGIKFLGNAGSHARRGRRAVSVTHDDILDALEILEGILDELVGNRSKKMAALAKKLAKRHAS